MEKENIDLNKCEYFYEQEGLKLCKDNLSGSCHPNCNIYQILQELQQLKQENEELRKIQIGFSQGENLYNLYSYQNCIDEINKVCQVNAINTCWTALNQCDNCEEKEECGTQSPFVKLDIIRNIIKKTKTENNN